MVRLALAGAILATMLAGTALAGDNKSPRLTPEAKKGAQTTQENIVKMKLRKVQPQPPPPQTPSLGGPPPAPPPPAPVAVN